jgi:hypothetical protein
VNVRMRTYTAYSIRCAIVWAVILIVTTTVASTARKHTFYLGAAGWRSAGCRRPSAGACTRHQSPAGRCPMQFRPKTQPHDHGRCPRPRAPLASSPAPPGPGQDLLGRSSQHLTAAIRSSASQIGCRRSEFSASHSATPSVALPPMIAVAQSLTSGTAFSTARATSATSNIGRSLWLSPKHTTRSA